MERIPSRPEGRLSPCSSTPRPLRDQPALRDVQRRLLIGEAQGPRSGAQGGLSHSCQLSVWQALDELSKGSDVVGKT